ncbi:MAG: type II secretion system GspH family protein [bacterium]|nr:type II secretion system GspH family protein [bacterium]
MIRLSSRSAGFTLLEVLLSISIIVALTGLSAPVYLGFQQRNDLDVATTGVANAIRRAQLLSQSSEGDATWGVYVASGQFVVFKGGSYATRETPEDEASSMSGAVAASGASEVVFNKLTGNPQTTGNITLSNAGETRNITINAKGIVAY